MSEIPNTNEIKMYWHCRSCMEENLPAKIGAGWTTIGFQVWCENHEFNIIHVDFEGVKHPANMQRKKVNGERGSNKR